MRPVLAIMIWIVLIGGLSMYIHARERINPGRSYEVSAAADNLALEVTTTFDVEPDPFALRTDAETDAAALLVRINGKEVLRRSDRMERGVPLRLEPVQGLIQGRNEIYLEANPPLDNSGHSLAVRLRVLRGDQPVADRSFWSDTGSRVAATFPVTIEAEKDAKAGTHDH